jgi:hypothetical protein
MPYYCIHSIVIAEQANIRQIISLLSKEQFHNNQGVCELDNNQFDIDARNDVRAIVSNENRLIRVCCRYANDVQRINKKIINFANNHPSLCELTTN